MRQGRWLVAVVALCGAVGGVGCGGDDGGDPNGNGDVDPNGYTREDLHTHPCLNSRFDPQNHCDECGDLLDYQCGSRTICGAGVRYGECPAGYDCHDNLCHASPNRSCDGVSCGGEEHCAQGVCLLTVPGNTYFVATDGDDANPGTFEQPFRTWNRAPEVMQPGDITYVRGGVWQPSERPAGQNSYGLDIHVAADGNAVSGTAAAPIRYYNYPGEKPILDGKLMGPNEYRWHGALSVTYAEHIHLRGLTVRHIHQSPPDPSHAKPHSEAFGIGSSGANLRFENMVAHDIDGRGFQHWSYAWTALDGPDALFESDSTSWINCDAYNLFDLHSATPGNAADGWKVDGYYGNQFYWEGCRAFNYSDDGFDPHGQSYRTFSRCWAMSTDRYLDVASGWDIEGNGFKIAGVGTDYLPHYELGGESFVRVENCVAADNLHKGFYNNILVDFDTTWPNGGVLHNNLGYNNEINFGDSEASTLRNNIAYFAQGVGPIEERYEVDINTDNYVESHNTWVLNPGEGWPPWLYNPAFDVTDEDFLSLDTRQLKTIRDSDRSLPAISFGHLAPTSDLIDGGTNVGLPYAGNAPDLGAFESTD